MHRRSKKKCGKQARKRNCDNKMVMSRIICNNGVIDGEVGFHAYFFFQL